MGSWESFSFIFRMREITHLRGDSFARFREGENVSMGGGGIIAKVKSYCRRVETGSKIEVEGFVLDRIRCRRKYRQIWVF